MRSPPRASRSTRRPTSSRCSGAPTWWTPARWASWSSSPAWATTSNPASRRPDDAEIQLLSNDEATAGSQVDLEHRWCTECTITGDALDHRRLREQASGLGSSLVVAGTRNKVRLHIHTNDPPRVFALAAGFGAVAGQKADDMQRQQEMAHHAARRRVAVVTDSAADLPESVLEALDMHVVPVRVHFGTRSYLDKVGLSSEDFFRLLAASPVHPKTSQPPPGDFRRAFEFLGSHYEAVVYVGLMSRVSGTFQSAETAVSRARTRAKILTHDSGTAALGQGLIAMRAAEAAAEGGDADSVRAAAIAAAARTRTWGCLVTLEFAVRGGRVPAWIKPVADALGLVPILTGEARRPPRLRRRAVRAQEPVPALRQAAPAPARSRTPLADRHLARERARRRGRGARGACGRAAARGIPAHHPARHGARGARRSRLRRRRGAGAPKGTRPFMFVEAAASPIRDHAR